jgi:hypothetical protein
MGQPRIVPCRHLSLLQVTELWWKGGCGLQIGEINPPYSKYVSSDSWLLVDFHTFL